MPGVGKKLRAIALLGLCCAGALTARAATPVARGWSADPEAQFLLVVRLPSLRPRDGVRASRRPLAGLMGIRPLGAQPGPYFALLAELARRHGVAGLSMGMSSDYPTAVMLGATVVRVGSALFDD